MRKTRKKILLGFLILSSIIIIQLCLFGQSHSEQDLEKKMEEISLQLAGLYKKLDIITTSLNEIKKNQENMMQELNTIRIRCSR